MTARSRVWSTVRFTGLAGTRRHSRERADWITNRL